MYGYKVYINLLLYKIGLRHILPSAIVNNKQVCECGEKLEKFQDVMVRQTVAEMLKKANALLPNGFELKILCGYHSIQEQQENWDKGMYKLKDRYPDLPLNVLENMNRKMCADPRNGFGPHQTGGAVDLTLTYNGKSVDMGGEYNSGKNSRTKTANLTHLQKQNRNILNYVMKTAGFQNYPNEWWHWSYGDRAYAAYKHKKCAIYGKI